MFGSKRIDSLAMKMEIWRTAMPLRLVGIVRSVTVPIDRKTWKPRIDLRSEVVVGEVKASPV